MLFFLWQCGICLTWCSVHIFASISTQLLPHFLLLLPLEFVMVLVLTLLSHDSHYVLNQRGFPLRSEIYWGFQKDLPWSRTQNIGSLVGSKANWENYYWFLKSRSMVEGEKEETDHSFHKTMAFDCLIAKA